MFNKSNSQINEMFLAFLEDIYNAEKQLVEALPKMAKACTSQNLAKCFQTHLKETEKQVKRLEEVFKLLNLPVKGKTCEAMKGLIEEAKGLVSEYNGQPFLDAGLIGAAQKVEHYEIATYGCLCTWAEVMQLDAQIIQLFNQSLAEEKNADQLLTDIAEREINAQTFSSYQKVGSR